MFSEIIGTLLKTAVLKGVGGKTSSQTEYTPVHIPEVNFKKYWTSSPTVQTSQVASAVRPADMQATSKYRRLLEMMMENRRAG